MPSRTWTIEFDPHTRPHQVTVERGYWSCAWTVTVDGDKVFGYEPGVWRYGDECLRRVCHDFPFAGHTLTVRSTESRLGVELFVDGRAPQTGEVLDRRAPPQDGLFLVGLRCASLTFLSMIYLFVVTFIYGRFAVLLGPRWFAGTELVLGAAVMVFLGSFGGYLLAFALLSRSLKDRLAAIPIVALTLFMCVSAIWSLPQQIGDVLLSPVEREVVVVGATVRDRKTPTITTSDGMTYEWQTAYGLYDYPQVTPGAYHVVLTPLSHRIVGLRQQLD